MATGARPTGKPPPSPPLPSPSLTSCGCMHTIHTRSKDLFIAMPVPEGWVKRSQTCMYRVVANFHG